MVDDNLKNIQVLVNLLSTDNYNVEYATNGNEALIWTKNGTFDLILLDIMMPEMDGFEVCKKIKQNPELADIPIIFLTAKDDIESITRGFTIGGVDFITKPFNTEELQARVKTHLELRKNREKLKNINKWLEEQVEMRTIELKRSNEQLSLAKKELEKIDVAKTEFLRMISHELRTPLNGIIGFINLIKATIDLSTISEYLEFLDSSVNRLEQFSLKALDISELRLKGSKIFANSDIDLIMLYAECLQELTPLMNEKKIKPRLIKNEGDYIICADHHLNKQNLFNILHNAVTYSPENEEIHTEFSIHSNIISCKISDKGEGFPQEIINKPFDPFILGSKHINKNIGLNLHFSKLLMDAQNGHIFIGNNPEGGAYVILEYQKKQNPE